MKMDIFKITTEYDKIIVEGTVNPHDPRSQRRVNLNTADVLRFLEDSGIDFGTCVQESELNNSHADTCTGNWIFEKKAEKTLDKPTEKVILSKEKKAAPKKKSKAKKKTSK
jgi:hypothetical protein